MYNYTPCIQPLNNNTYRSSHRNDTELSSFTVQQVVLLLFLTASSILWIEFQKRVYLLERQSSNWYYGKCCLFTLTELLPPTTLHQADFDIVMIRDINFILFSSQSSRG